MRWRRALAAGQGKTVVFPKGQRTHRRMVVKGLRSLRDGCAALDNHPTVPEPWQALCNEEGHDLPHLPLRGERRQAGFLRPSWFESSLFESSFDITAEIAPLTVAHIGAAPRLR